MDPFCSKTMTIAVLVCTGMAIRAVQKQSLTYAGAIAGIMTGFLMISTGLRGLVLMCFYQIGNVATKYKLSVKSKHDATLASHSSRGATQVLCVSLLACLLSIYHAIIYGPEQEIIFYHTNNTIDSSSAASHITCAIVAHHATCLADTLASECGMLSYARPVLITRPWRGRVPIGCNGGITLTGCIWSVVGGCITGILTVCMDWLSGLQVRQYSVKLILYASIIGLIGSLFDSILGAVLQATYWDNGQQRIYHADNRPQTAQLLCGFNLLSNEQVNLVSTCLAVYVGGWIVAPMILP